MAKTITTSSGRVYPAIDPSSPPQVRMLTGKGIAEQELPDPEHARLAYDRLSDVLTLRFGDPRRPAVVSSCIDDMCLLLDPVTEALLGYHIDNFLRVVVKEEPMLVSALQIAELRGMTAVEAERVQAQILDRRPIWGRSFDNVLRHVFRRPRSRLTRNQEQVVRETLHNLFQAMHPA